MTMPDNQKSGVFDAIPNVQRTPPSDADEKTKAELRRLTPTEQVQADHEALVRRLDSHIDKLDNVILDLRTKNEILQSTGPELAKLREERCWKSWISVCSGVAALVGSSFISSASLAKIFLGLGWGLVAIAAILLLGSSFAVNVIRSRDPNS